jgi:hypothetical protein
MAAVGAVVLVLGLSSTDDRLNKPDESRSVTVHTYGQQGHLTPRSAFIYGMKCGTKQMSWLL